MVTFRIPDMTCGHCASTIARAVADADKSARVEVSIPDKLVSVTSTAAEDELLQAIRDAGYSPQKVPAPAAGSPPARGCGCGCATRPPASVDARQARPAARGSCCG
jgi:copper chaperone